MFLTLFSSFGLSSKVAGTCIRGSDGKGVFYSSEEKNFDAYALWDDSIEENGWATIHISTNKNSSSENQMYCAGFLDAYLASERIYNMVEMYRAENDATEKWPDHWEDWIQQNMDYIDGQIANPTDKYWTAMKLIIAQFDGMVDALAQTRKDGQREITRRDFWIFQSGGDFDDLAEFLNPGKGKPAELREHCTGMFKFAENYSDVYFSQNTWSDYRDLLAYLKSYNFSIPEFKASVLSFSTRMGHINSDDDYWQADTGLFILETTMHTWNTSLYSVITPNSVLTWMRSYYATLVSDSGKEWTEEFIKQNSGTYNNEYIVLDAKKFTPGQKPTTDLLWIIEQYPGIYRSKDITSEFIEQTYWPSVNTPWFEDLYSLAGYPYKDLPVWTYYEQPRYLVMKKHHGEIVDYASFQRFMRIDDFNNTDEPNYGEPSQGTESRYDLRPENGTINGARSCFGGLDSKTSSATKLLKDLSFDAINSPVYESSTEYTKLTPFSFDDWPDVAHPGLPSKWEFTWQSFAPIALKCNATKDQETCLSIDGCGFCLYSQECLPLLSKDRPSYGYKCEDGWKTPTVTPSWAIPLVISVSVIVVVFVAIIYILAYFQYKKDKLGTPTYDQIK